MGAGNTIALIKALAKVDPETIQDSVNDWLDDHPEATTTVQDGSITKAKLDNSLQATVDDVSDLQSAINVLEPTASASDVGKMLKVKIVSDGKVTEYEFGEGGGSVTVDDALSTSSTNPVQNKVITAEVNSIEDILFTTKKETTQAEDLFEKASDDMTLGINNSSFDATSDGHGFYVPVMDYQGKELLIIRKNNGAVLRGAYSASVPAANVQFVGDRWENNTNNKKQYLTTVPQGANYLYIMYYNPNSDSITREQAIEGMKVYQMDQTNLFDNASQTDMHLSFNSGIYGTVDSAYGFYVPIDDSETDLLYIKRKNAGKRFRVAFSESVPAVGVSYSGYLTFDTSTANVITIPDGSKYMYVLYYNSSADTSTRSELLEEMSIKLEKPATVTVETKTNSIDIINKQLFTDGTRNLYEDRSDDIAMGIDTTAFSENSSLIGFYIPIDPNKGTTVTIRKLIAGVRFRVVATQNVPAVGTTYESSKRVYADGYRQIVYTNIGVNDRYLYIAYMNTELDTYTKEQLLEGMTIYYGTEYNESESRIYRLDRISDNDYKNGNINEIGTEISDSNHIVSGRIDVDGRFGISCPDDYVVDIHFFNNDDTYVGKVQVTDSVTYHTHNGYIRVCISADDSSEISPSTVDISQIKTPLNKKSAMEYTKQETIILDAENCKSANVYDYIDSVARNHGMYVTKTLLCTESSGLPVYYYTLGSGNKKIMIVSGQHGPSSNGDPRDSVITVSKIIHDLIDTNFTQGSFLQKLHDDFTIVVIPVLNVYGFDNFSRKDANETDTNRDWVDATSIEVYAAKTLITSFDPFMVLDVHTNGDTPVSNENVEMQFGFGTHNSAFKSAIENQFGTYYNMTVQSREPNATTTLDYYVCYTLERLGGLLELRWWLKDKIGFHDYQAESGNYAVIINSIKYFNAVNDSETFEYEHTPNQKQY